MCQEKYAGMAELVDALDLESSSRGVQVRFLLPAPLENIKSKIC